MKYLENMKVLVDEEAFPIPFFISSRGTTTLIFTYTANMRVTYMVLRKGD